ncbi:LLM class flavin-dependent oxidoreductase [Rhodococcus sp. NCIMB 12038]|nr:LLM class flavin-dependent oxidoreductase [Rhodococcus sp. NCIMB 12038]
MKFGVFLGPWHKIGMNPTLALERDLQLIDLLDELGFDEAWIGEHHSGGVEITASPELMIAAAAQRTRQIKLGTGVSSLPYHQPFMLADRILQLDHMTRGRMMFGVGPGQLLKDAQMMGIETTRQRAMMEESLQLILRLFKGETVTHKSDWFELNEASLQMKPYSDFDVCVTGAVSPSGPKLAGRLGTGLLSLAATDPVGIERLGQHWDIVQAESREHGTVVDRSSWRLVGPMHIAESLEQAKEDVKYGLLWITQYLHHISPHSTGTYDDVDKLVDDMNESGRGVIGTPEMAIAQLERLDAKSGGFGTYLIQGFNSARWPATRRSYELFAEEVIPHFNGQLDVVKAGYEEVVSSGTEWADATRKAQAEATAAYQAERSLKVN